VALLCFGDVKVVENQQECTSAIHVLLKDLEEMARLSLRAKILPTGTEIDLDEIAKKIGSTLQEGMVLSKYTKEPLAFGLYFLNAEFSLDDREGQMDYLENTIRAIEGVGEFQVLGLSRTSVDMK
jgi:elongation factor 1-beta